MAFMSGTGVVRPDLRLWIPLSYLSRSLIAAFELGFLGLPTGSFPAGLNLLDALLGPVEILACADKLLEEVVLVTALPLFKPSSAALCSAVIASISA